MVNSAPHVISGLKRPVWSATERAPCRSQLAFHHDCCPVY